MAEGEKSGDPSRLTIVDNGGLEVGPDGFVKREPTADVLALLRTRGFSEEALAAFARGHIVILDYERTPLGNVPIGERILPKASGGGGQEKV